VDGISLVDADAGWAMVDCYHDVSIRTTSTECLYRLVHDQWRGVDVPEGGIPGATGAYACLRAISAVGPEEMWAVGMTHGVYGCQAGNWLVHYRNGEWEAVELGEEIAELDETFYSEHYDGLLAIDMVGADNGWIAGYGLIFRYEHGQWSLDLDLPSETAGTYAYAEDENAFRAISMANVNDGWAGGVGLLYRYRNGTWTRWEDPLFDSAIVADIEAVAPEEAWAVGYREIEREDGTVYAVPLMYHFANDRWHEITLPTEQGGLSAVSMVDSDEGWAVGWTDNSGILLHYIDGQWMMVSPPSSRSLHGAAGSDPEHVWIGGAEGLYQYAPPDDWDHDDLAISAFSTGILEVDIVYSDDFYRDWFGYTRQAENIKHYVLVMPEEGTTRATAHDVFYSIRFQVDPDDPLVKEGREEFAWAFDYLYEAPEGRFTGEFVPGKYHLAVAFIAVPKDNPSPGAPRGGASTEYQEIVIEPEQTLPVTIQMTDGDGWACPWLYVYDGRGFVRTTEILRNHRGKQGERTEVSHIGPVRIVDGTITVRVAEEREEIAYVDQLYLVVGGAKVAAESDPQVAAKVAERDQDYLIIASGESYEFRFRPPGAFGDLADVQVVATGFYVPLE
jgi:hypothetical protein